MKTSTSYFISFLFILGIATSGWSQGQQGQQKIVITGARFTYPLLKKWIADYKEANPSVEIVIEPRTTTDPANYDLLIEAYEPDASVKDQREYLFFGRYALLPVANSSSDFAKFYGDKGLTSDLIKQLFFHDVFADKEKYADIKFPYTVYTRQQKSGPPITFAGYFGYEQKNIEGKAIAGSDEHLLKAILNDQTAISYSHPGLVFDPATRKPIAGITILPVDADDNGRVSNDERFYSALDELISAIEKGDVKNLPSNDLHLSIPRLRYKPEALKFLQWVAHNGQEDLHAFGFLKPDQKRFESERAKFDQLTRK